MNVHPDNLDLKGETVLLRQLYGKAESDYAELINFCRTVISEIDRTYPVVYKKARRVIRTCLNSVQKNPFLLNMSLYGTYDSYLYSHSANVTILSLYLGKAYGMKEEELIQLGIAAIMHDTGMTRYLYLANQERELKDYEMEKIKNHVILSCENLDRIADFDYNFREEVAKTILHSHERHSGIGYPFGLKGSEINLMAQIISLADAYEAMTHFRPWRRALDHHAAIRQLIEVESSLFNPVALKKLTALLTVYPPGTLVKLTNGAVAEVFKTNPESFLKPIVKIVMDENFRKVRPYLVDLASNKLLGIDRVLDYREIEAKAPRFKGVLELSRIWVNWD